jgi:hypothetical protein
MNLFTQLLRDEHGFVLSAEMALLGTVGVIGSAVGLSAVAKSVNDELTDVAMAFRSLDQSYQIAGASGCGACTAGSCYVQPPVEESLKALAAEIDEAKAHAKKHQDQDQEHSDKDHHQQDAKAHDKDGDPQPPSMKKPLEKPEDKPEERKKREEQKKKLKKKLEQDEGKTSL